MEYANNWLQIRWAGGQNMRARTESDVLPASMYRILFDIVARTESDVLVSIRCFPTLVRGILGSYSEGGGSDVLVVVETLPRG